MWKVNSASFGTLIFFYNIFGIYGITFYIYIFRQYSCFKISYVYICVITRYNSNIVFRIKQRSITVFLEIEWVQTFNFVFYKGAICVRTLRHPNVFCRCEGSSILYMACLFSGC